MKIILHKDDDVGTGTVRLENNRFVARLYGTEGKASDLTGAIWKAIKGLRDRRHSFGHFPCYVFNLEGPSSERVVITFED